MWWSHDIVGGNPPGDDDGGGVPGELAAAVVAAARRTVWILWSAVGTEPSHFWDPKTKYPYLWMWYMKLCLL